MGYTRYDSVLVLDLQGAISGFDVGWDLLKNQNVLSVFLQTDRVCLDVLQQSAAQSRTGETAVDL